MTPLQRFAAMLVLAAAALPGLSHAEVVNDAEVGAEQPLGAPQPDKSVRDPEFGVMARYFGLERRVEMYQWQKQVQGYSQAWSEHPLDSGGFAPGHDNPPFPLQGKRWIAEAILIDGKRLDDDVVRALGEWHPFRPSFNALPGNLAATFQPLGDGLASAENPLDPQVGDLRITWRELILPPLQGKVVLHDGRWQLVATPVAAEADQLGEPKPAVDVSSGRWLSWLSGGGLLVVLIAALAAWRRRRKR